jgi:hypothetical protein
MSEKNILTLKELIDEGAHLKPLLIKGVNAEDGIGFDYTITGPDLFDQAIIKNSPKLSENQRQILETLSKAFATMNQEQNSQLNFAESSPSNVLDLFVFLFPLQLDGAMVKLASEDGERISLALGNLNGNIETIDTTTMSNFPLLVRGRR